MMNLENTSYPFWGYTASLKKAVDTLVDTCSICLLETLKMMIFFQGSQCPGLHQVHVQVSAVVFSGNIRTSAAPTMHVVARTKLRMDLIARKLLH